MNCKAAITSPTQVVSPLRILIDIRYCILMLTELHKKIKLAPVHSFNRLFFSTNGLRWNIINQNLIWLEAFYFKLFVSSCSCAWCFLPRLHREYNQVWSVYMPLPSKQKHKPFLLNTQASHMCFAFRLTFSTEGWTESRTNWTEFTQRWHVLPSSGTELGSFLG